MNFRVGRALCSGILTGDNGASSGALGEPVEGFWMFSCLENVMGFIHGSMDRGHPTMHGQSCSTKNCIASHPILKCFNGNNEDEL